MSPLSAGRWNRRILQVLFLNCALILVSASSSSPAAAQTAVTGALTGVVTDATGAVLPNAQVTLVDPAVGTPIKVMADAQGRYSYGLLKPGNYTITASLASFTANTVNVYVSTGSTTTSDIKMVPAGGTSIVDVNAAEVPLLDTQNIAIITTFNESQIQNLPTPGGDVTTLAFALPGVVVNTGGEYGNFSSDGLPGVSNLFVLNGFDNVDPFLNLNNSGSSNLTLGQGELAEASVVQNAYNSQFGRAAGAIIFYNTKSGSNHFHGELDYNNNTSVMNANSWEGNHTGSPRPHAVANQWAANIGGPIIKDKVFFFGDYEGLRYVLPGFSGLVTYPTAQLQSYILSQVPAGAQSLYKQAFAAYDAAPSYASATPASLTPGSGLQDDPNGVGGCGNLAGTLTGTGGEFGSDTPCISSAFASANNINKEWLFTGRADWHISDRHNIYGRYKMDRGSQPTSTSPINPLFSTVSIQPEYEGQFNDTYQFTPHMSNSFTLASNWYTAYFGPQNPAASSALYPDDLLPDLGYDGSGVNGAAGLSSIGVPYDLTQGRDVTQYQFEDDYTYSHGKHTYKAGFNFRRDLVSDYDQQVETVYPEVEFFTLEDYAPGQITPASPFYRADQFDQAFTATLHAHLALYNLGIYAQDEFQPISKLKLTIGARIDRTGNPLCHGNCFSQYQGALPPSDVSLTSAYISSAGGSISANNPHPFPSTQAVNFQARFGFNYAPNTKTEIRGGFGMFSDLYPAGFLDSSIENFPNYNAVSVISGGIYGAGSTGGTLRQNAALANQAILSGFASGGSVTSISDALSAQGVPFTPPSIGAYFPGEFKVPGYLEYSLQVERQFSKSDSIDITYAGNLGYDGTLINPLANPGSGQWNQTTSPYGPADTWQSVAGYNFAGYSPTPLDPRFSKITAYTDGNHSNYNGLQIDYKHTGHGFTGQFNYTYSHELDVVSNGGSGEPFSGTSVTTQITPDLSANNLNYSSGDYDVRHNFSAAFIYEEPKRFSNFIVNEVAGGWTAGVKTYARSGTPFTVANGSDLADFPNLSTTLTPLQAVPKLTDTCSNGKKSVSTSCLNASDFVGWGYDKIGAVVETATQTTFGNIHRNAFRGPHYVDTDLSLLKSLYKHEAVRFEIGANAYNLFNHVNFAAPGSNLGTNGFGLITGTVAPPTSPYGSFQGNGVTQRLVQVHGKLTF
jgi:hypothetical protein